MGDLISRQDAIDVVKRISLGETDTTRLAMRIEDYLIRLSSAQTEKIRCKDCKNWAVQVKDVNGDGLGSCKFHKANFVTGEGYCYWAERRMDDLISRKVAIDADTLILKLDEEDIPCNADIDDVIRKAPTVNPNTPHWECEGRCKKAELEEPYFVARCSYCKSTFRITRRYRYCPCCGSFMVGY